MCWIQNENLPLFAWWWSLQLKPFLDELRKIFRHVHTLPFTFTTAGECLEHSGERWSLGRRTGHNIWMPEATDLDILVLTYSLSRKSQEHVWSSVQVWKKIQRTTSLQSNSASGKILILGGICARDYCLVCFCFFLPLCIFLVNVTKPPMVIYNTIRPSDEIFSNNLSRCDFPPKKFYNLV